MKTACEGAGARHIPAPDVDAVGVSQDAVVNEGGVAVTRRVMHALLSPDAPLRHSERYMHIAGEKQRQLTAASSTMVITECTVACRKIHDTLLYNLLPAVPRLTCTALQCPTCTRAMIASAPRRRSRSR